MLLNVGPRPDGQIDATQGARIREIGQWLNVYCESTYGTRGGPWLPEVYGVSHHGNLVYIHVLNIPRNSLRVLPTFPVRVMKAAALHGADVQFEQTAQTLTFSVPSGPQDSIDAILKLELAEPWTTSKGSSG